MRYSRTTVTAGRYARFMPQCLCASEVDLELVAYTIADGRLQYRLGCVACGKLGRQSIPHGKIAESSKATAKPFRLS